MVLIVGGVYQGKLDYALNRFGFTKEQVYFCDDKSINTPANKKIVNHFDKWILALLKSNRTEAEMASEVQKFANSCLDAIVICNDISCGVVPIDPLMRAWREAVGRSLGTLSQQADEVIRLYCGIPTTLK